MFGFTKTVAREGQKYNIVVNAVAARTDPSLSDTINAKDIIVALLSSRQAPATGQIYEASSCWVGTLRWQRSGGVDFEDEDGVPSADAVFKVGGAQTLSIYLLNVDDRIFPGSATSTMAGQTIQLPQPKEVDISTRKALMVQRG